MSGFSLNVLGFSFVNYWLRNGDNLLIGKFIGPAALGLYARCYGLMLMPLTSISRALADVLFPAFSLIQEDRRRVGQAYLRAAQAVACVTFPMMMGLWVVAGPFVMAVYGPAWAGMIPILKILCIVGALQSVGTLNGALYLSQGRSGLQFFLGTVFGVVGLASMVIGLRWGVIGVARAYAVFTVLVFIPSVHLAVRLVGLSALDIIRSLSKVTASTVFMALVVFGAQRLLPPGASPWLHLLVTVPLGAAVHAAGLYLLGVEALQDLAVLLRRGGRGGARRPALHAATGRLSS